MEGQLLEWLAFLVRWIHVIAGIAWIGASFYFIWLDQSLVPTTGEKAARGLKGELFAIHGGGIYEVGKYQLAPPQMPETLHWFKWEAYTTWLSGSALLIVLYYVRAQSYLIGADTWVQTPAAAITASVLYLLTLLGLYEATIRSPLKNRPLIFALLITIVVTLASWIAWQLFTPRAAMLHVGAALATIMAGNVFLGIIPAQRGLVAAIEQGLNPDAGPALLAKLRSTHNNYFTLPVLFCMLGNHAPFLYTGSMAWLMVVALALTAATARHFFNLRNQGRHQPGWLIGPALAFFALVLVSVSLSSSTDRPASNPNQSKVADHAEIAQIMTRHCTPCHARTPVFPGYATPPAGLLFEQPDDLRGGPNAIPADRIRTALVSSYMPLGNLTAMTPEERSKLIAWLPPEP